MANTINVTACDNELIIIAYQATGSFEIARVLSGNFKAVNLSLSLTAGPYMGSMNINSVSTDLSAKLNVSLPAGSYSLLLLGVNWGGPTQFKVAVNNTAYNSPGGSPVGCVWNPGPIAITV